jgi:hypothetical protein
MKNLKPLTILLLFFGLFCIVTLLPLTKAIEPGIVHKALIDREKLKQKAYDTFSNDDFYDRSLRFFTAESNLSINIKSKRATLLQTALLQDQYELILNEDNDAEYLMEIVVFNDLEYKIESLYLRMK